MRKILASLLASVGLASEAQPGPKVQTIDPNTVLFSTPTLSDDLASLEPVATRPSSTDFVFHEDEWSQVEFLTKDRLPEVQKLLKEYKAFEQVHRAQYGWRKVYVRKLDFKLTQAFMKLNASNGLLLVDWRSQLVLVAASKSGEVEVWRP